MGFKPGVSGNVNGRPKGAFSAENGMKRAQDRALRNIAAAAEKGDIAASIAVVEFNARVNSK